MCVCVVGQSVWRVICGKSAEWISMLIDVVGQMHPRICSVDLGGDRSTRRSNFGGGYGAGHCSQWGYVALLCENT